MPAFYLHTSKSLHKFNTQLLETTDNRYYISPVSGAFRPDNQTEKGKNMNKYKFVAAAVAIFTTFAVFADESSVMAGFWFNTPRKARSSQVEGVAFGLPVFDGNDLEGAGLSLIGSRFREVEGFQGTLIGFTRTGELSGLQLSFANLVDGNAGDEGVQIGIYNQSRRGGIQIGLVNNCQNNAKVQVGLININKNGLFPVMIFVNFDRDMFD